MSLGLLKRGDLYVNFESFAELDYLCVFGVGFCHPDKKVDKATPYDGEGMCVNDAN